MKTTLIFLSEASLAFQKASAGVTIELAEGEKLTAKDKETFQDYTVEMALKGVKKLADGVQELAPTVKVADCKPVVVTTVTEEPDLGEMIVPEKFIRAASHKLKDATPKELKYISGLTSKTYAQYAEAAQKYMEQK